jgi:hypothetical protein
MIGIKNRRGESIAENRGGLFQGNAMLREVRGGFLFVPFKTHVPAPLVLINSPDSVYRRRAASFHYQRPAVKVALVRDSVNRSSNPIAISILFLSGGVIVDHSAVFRGLSHCRRTLLEAPEILDFHGGGPNGIRTRVSVTTTFSPCCLRG